jgi:hypothetical protein
MKDLYEHLINEKNLAPHVARSAVARKIAILSFAIMSSGNKFDPHRGRKEKTEIN